MKTTLNIFLLCLGFLLSNTLTAQTNYSVNLPSGQEVHNLYGNICCFFKINVATDEAGNAYVLSEQTSDSSVWVTKYDANGNLIYNTHVQSSFTTDNRYFAKKIRVYDKVYVVTHTIFNFPNAPSQEYDVVYTLDKNTGVVDLVYSTFAVIPPYTSSELIDVVQSGNVICMIGQTYSGSGPGSAKVQVQRSDLTWTGNVFIQGNNASTDYLLNTESTCFTYYNGALYMTGQTSSSSGNFILITKLDVWGFWTEYMYQNPSYTVGGKGLSIAAEGNAVYVSGAMRAQTTKPFKATILKMDSSLTAPMWVSINQKSEWPLAIQLSSGNVIYTVDYALRVVGFSKTNGSQLFAKDDFKNYAQVYNQPISSVILSNNQLMFQASVGVKVNGNNTVNKVTAKYSTSGMKVYQQLESLSLISPGNPGNAEALGLAYSNTANYAVEVFRKYSSAGNLFYVNGRNTPTALRVAAAQDGEEVSLSAFPNPVSEKFRVESDQKITHWTLVDALGQQIFNRDADNNAIEIDCTSLPSGMYFLNVMTEGEQMQTQKLIVSHQK